MGGNSSGRPHRVTCYYWASNTQNVISTESERYIVPMTTPDFADDRMLDDVIMTCLCKCIDTGRASPDSESYCCLCSRTVAALLQLGHKLADRSRDQGWLAVASQDTVVTELLSCPKGKPTTSSPKFVSTPF